MWRLPEPQQKAGHGCRSNRSIKKQFLCLAKPLWPRQTTVTAEPARDDKLCGNHIVMELVRAKNSGIDWPGLRNYSRGVKSTGTHGIFNSSTKPKLGREISRITIDFYTRIRQKGYSLLQNEQSPLSKVELEAYYSKQTFQKIVEKNA